MKNLLIVPFFIFLFFFFVDGVYGQFYQAKRCPTLDEIEKAKQEFLADLKTFDYEQPYGFTVVHNITNKVIIFHNTKTNSEDAHPYQLTYVYLLGESKVDFVPIALIDKTDDYGRFIKFEFSAGNSSFRLLKSSFKISLQEAETKFTNYMMEDGDTDFGFHPDCNQESTSPTSDYNSESNEDDNGNTWTVIVGIITVAVLLGIRNRRKKLKAKKENSPAKDKKKSDKKKENADYILQLNKKEFALNLQEPQALEAKVWKVTEKGKSLVNASIRVQTPDKALKIIPFSATGNLNSQLTLQKTPTNAQFNISVTAQAEGKTYQQNVKITTGNRLIIETAPDNTRNLRPNLDQNLTCFAQVVDADNKDIPELTKKIKFDNSNEPWIDLLEDGPYLDEGWAAMLIGASDPKADYDISHPPKSVTLDISVEYKEENKEIRLENDLTINLLDCKLEIDLEQVTFPATKEQTEITFKANIEDCDGSKPWKFKAVYMKDFETVDKKPLTEIDIDDVKDTEVKITLTGPILLPKEDEQFIRKLFVVSAQQEEETALERHIYVMVSREGLFIENGVNENQEIAFVAKGDYTHEIDMALYVYDEKTDQIIVDKLGLQNLYFELMDKDEKLKNIASVLKPHFSFDTYFTTIPFAKYTLEVPNKFPGFGDEYKLIYRVTVLDSDNPNSLKFDKIITLKVQDYGIGEKFPSWEKAYKNCRYTIIKFIPDSNQRNQLLDMLEKNKYKFDIEGMVAYKNKIWLVAHDLMINKKEGYLVLANWYKAIEDTLKWVVWMGDIAFQVVLATYTGYAGGLLASAFKQTFLTGVRLAIEGKSVDDFVKEEMHAIEEMLYSTVKGRVLNTQVIEKFYKGEKYKVWAIYSVATFAMHYKRLGSVPQAAKETARGLRDEVIIRFLSGQVRKGQAELKAKDSEKKKSDSKNKTKNTDKGKNDYKRAENPPDVSGYTSASMKAIQRVANKFKARIITRPTNAAARRLLKSGQAVPKKMFVKNKTINALDTFLGASKKDIGKVGSFKPKLSRQQIKNLPKAMRREIVKRYRQRSEEYTDQAQHILDNSDKLEVKKGVVYDKKSGKPFTGDIDVFDIRGANGEKLPPKKILKIIKALKKSNIKTNIEHGAHVEWDWKSIKDPNDRRIAKDIYDKIINDHTMDKGKSIAKNIGKGKKEALVQFEPGTSGGVKMKSVLYNK